MRRVPNKTEFYGILRVYRDVDEIIGMYTESFHAASIQSAKATLTKIANQTELFSWIQSWDNEKRTYTGKDLRWKPWDAIDIYNHKGEVAYSTRRSESVPGETIYPESYPYGKSVRYWVDLVVNWRLASNKERASAGENQAGT